MGILSMHNGYPEHAEHVICSCVCTREDALHLEYTHTEYTHTECAHMQSAHTRTHAHTLLTYSTSPPQSHSHCGRGQFGETPYCRGSSWPPAPGVHREPPLPHSAPSSSQSTWTTSPLLGWSGEENMSWQQIQEQ